VPFLALVVVGWLLTCAALVTGRVWLLAVAAPFFVLCGIVTLVNRRAWSRLTSAALTSGVYSSDYRERVRSSDPLRRFISVCLVVTGVGWLAVGLLL
jgi:hypothetical protein